MLPAGDRRPRGRHHRDRDRLRGGQAAASGGEVSAGVKTISSHDFDCNDPYQGGGAPLFSTHLVYHTEVRDARRHTGRQSAAARPTTSSRRRAARRRSSSSAFPEVIYTRYLDKGLRAGLAVMQRLPDRRPAQPVGAGPGDEPGAAEVLGRPAVAPRGKRRGSAVRQPLRVRAASGDHLLRAVPSKLDRARRARRARGDAVHQGERGRERASSRARSSGSGGRRSTSSTGTSPGSGRCSEGLGYQLVDSKHNLPPGRASRTSRRSTSRRPTRRRGGTK